MASGEEIDATVSTMISEDEMIKNGELGEGDSQLEEKIVQNEYIIIDEHSLLDTKPEESIDIHSEIIQGVSGNSFDEGDSAQLSVKEDNFQVVIQPINVSVPEETNSLTKLSLLAQKDELINEVIGLSKNELMVETIEADEMQDILDETFHLARESFEQDDLPLTQYSYPYDICQENDYSWAQMEEVITETIENKKRLTPIFLDIMCKKNNDKTKHLVLRGNQLINNSLKRRLCDNDLSVLHDYLKDNRSVVSLDLAYNHITSEGLKNHLIPLLKQNQILKELILSNNEICIQGLQELSDISTELSLISLRLNGNKLGPKSGEAMSRLLSESKLLHLDISETDQNVSSLACIAAILRNDYIPCIVNHFPYSRKPLTNDDSNHKDKKICTPSSLEIYLKHLLRQQSGREESNSLLTLSRLECDVINCTSIDWTQSLKKFKIKKNTNESQLLLGGISSSYSQSSNNGKNESMDCVCHPFIETVKIKTEDVEDKKIQNKPILEILFLDRILGHYHYQPLTYHFTRVLSEMIKANNSLRELHLEKNSLTDSDIQAICQGLKENKTLKLLDLSANHIGCLGISHISNCLSSTALEALILNHNDISDHGARCLFFSMSSSKLKMLDLAYNSISDTGMMDLLYTMRKHPKILALFIWGNPITHVSLTKIKEYLIHGWLLTDTLDIQIYEVDNVLYHAWKPAADPYKSSYYTRPMAVGPDQVPSQTEGTPIKFKYYHSLYSRKISQYIPKKYLFSPLDSNSCTI